MSVDIDVTTILGRYDEVRACTERIAAPLSPEDQTVQSMPDVSPTKTDHDYASPRHSRPMCGMISRPGAHDVGICRGGYTK